jgi:hypothetical protein
VAAVLAVLALAVLLHLQQQLAVATVVLQQSESLAVQAAAVLGTQAATLQLELAVRAHRVQRV